MNCLVTGSRGFIGEHLIRYLYADKTHYSIVGLGRKGGEDVAAGYLTNFDGYIEVNADICNPFTVQRIMNEFRPDIIFHFAAIPIVKLDEDNPTAVSHVNILGTQTLLHYAPKGSTFVFASSATVYGDLGNIKVCDESDVLRPTSVYGATKVASEAMINAYSTLHHLNAVSLRFVANVGRGATHGVIKDIIRKLKSDKPELELLGDSPGSCKPYTHVEDSVEAAVLLGTKTYEEQRRGHNIYNIATEDILFISDLADIAMKATGIKKPIKWLGAGANWSGDNRYVRVDSHKAHLQGWEPKYKTSAEVVFAAVKELS